MRGSWLTSAGNDMTLATSDDMSNWNEWMQYDPAAAPSQHTQRVESKPVSAQGPTAFLKPGQQQSSPFNRPQQPEAQSQPQSHSQPQPSNSIPISAPMYSQGNGTPFTFGQSIEVPPAFDFNGNPLSSPADAEVQQQNGFYSPPIWQHQQQHQQQQQQQQQKQQQQHMADSGFFPNSRFDHSTYVAPPPPTSTPSLHHSPSSLNNGRASSSSSHSSPEPIPNAKKRKSLEDDDDDLDSAPVGKNHKGQPPKKTAHNMIEKRYRTNLNDKIAALRDSVPSLRVMSRPNGTEEDDDPEDLEGLTPAHKLNKATVLSKATEYIRHLEKRNKRLSDEVTTLKGRLESYEKMAISGPMVLHGAVSTPDGSRYHEDSFMQQHGLPMGGPPQGMIPVPDNIAALQRGLPPQQHYASAYPAYAGGTRQVATRPPMVNGRRTSAMMGKLMVGSLAGLMVLEGLVEREESQESPAGLFALPINLASILAPRVSIGASTTQLPLAKFLLVFGAFFYLLAPLLNSRSKPKRKAPPGFLLSPAPSLASPVEVRRTAWLTAIQTVWVPQHNFILEVAALGLKTLKLSTRKIIGWQGYAYLTGITKEQEAARVKAWEIALDAQLTGGDAEISKNRLILTLMASGTLPDTPARLMLKALHIRVLLWEIANAGHGSWWMVDDLSAVLARSYWNMARSEHRIAANLAPKQGNETEAQPLPAHLAALIERECDEVLVPAIVQRAYNLAWNKQSAEKTIIDPSMDGVVEDSAICSPLDALAAWYSSLTLNKALASTLATKSSSPKDRVISDLDLAVQSAPPNSQAQLRAFVAQAVVLDDDRNTRIATAYKALPITSGSKTTGLINLVDSAPVAADIRKALTLAKCLSLISSTSVEAHDRTVFAVNNTFLPEITTTLLSFVAAHKVLTLCMQDDALQADTSAGLERIAKSLRMWMGHETGDRSGLNNKARRRIIQSCLDASTSLVGLKQKDDVDDGYVSASVQDGE
ncbi:hypothetical protein GQ44DRAFT_711519 [Phaeosphaeriaceae sp. PMI808]|nr:hypothetical protein GQ44DRAFT_711519 [Phaeosphaeriaceae sp. PMI808]